MKIGTFLATALLSSQVFAGTTTLLTRTMSVGFAPPEYRGQFKTEIKSDGVVQYVNNKGVVKKVAKLSAEAVLSLKNQIEAVKVEPLTGDKDGAPCMDAPSTNITMHKGNEEVSIYQEAGCQPLQMNSAYELIDIIQAANSLSTLVR